MGTEPLMKEILFSHLLPVATNAVVNLRQLYRVELVCNGYKLLM